MCRALATTQSKVWGGISLRFVPDADATRRYSDVCVCVCMHKTVRATQNNSRNEWNENSPQHRAICTVLSHRCDVGRCVFMLLSLTSFFTRSDFRMANKMNAEKYSVRHTLLVNSFSFPFLLPHFFCFFILRIHFPFFRGSRPTTKLLE